MKIGIITFHKAHNYGAVIQCFALQETLRNMGHNVRIIDYRQPTIERAYKVFDFKKWAKYVLSLKKDALTYLYSIPVRMTKKRNFERFVSLYCNLTQIANPDDMPQDFDCYIVGSDQVWNWKILDDKLDSVYIGEFKRPKSSRLIGYAISGNLASLDMLGVDYLKKVITKFDLISFREGTLSKVVNCLTGIQVHVCCDPTLLTDPFFWDSVTNTKFQNRKYVLLYEVRYPKADRLLLCKKAQKLASIMGCELIIVNSGKYSVEDFVSLFKYASHIVTSSFHATAFSLIFQRPFYAVKLKDGFDGRYENLLHAIKADNLCVDTNFDPVPVKPDFRPITQALSNYRQQSLNFLKLMK